MLSPLRLERLKRGLKQGQVAKDTGIDQSQYCRFELGKATPTAAQATTLSEYFGNAISEMQVLYPARFSESVEHKPFPRKRRKKVAA